MGTCLKCQFFRSIKPHSQLLAAAIKTTHADVTKELSKVSEDEQKLRDAEIELQSAQASAGNDDWTTQPIMSEYCGINEKDSVYKIWQVKNAGNVCGDFNGDKPPRHACSDCSQRIKSTGDARDAEREQMYADMSVSATFAESKSDSSKNMLDEHRSSVAARKAFELSGAYHTKGKMLTCPEYLDYCRKLSVDDTFAICVLINPWHTCGEWQPNTLESGSLADATLLSKSQSSLQDLKMDETVESKSLPLEKLTEQISALEWILESKFADSNKAILMKLITDEYQKNDKSDQQLQFLLEKLRQARTQDPVNITALKQGLQLAFVFYIRQHPEKKSSQFLISLYDAANPTFTPGNPPLTLKAAYSYLEFMSFVQSLQNGLEWHGLSEEIMKRGAEFLIHSYTNFPQQVKMFLAEFKKMWDDEQAFWNSLNDNQRGEHRYQIVIAYGQAVTNMLSSPFAISTNSGGVTDQLDAIFAMNKKQVEELSATDPVLALQVKMENQKQMASLMSNLIKIQHETSMSIIGNMK